MLLVDTAGTFKPRRPVFFNKRKNNRYEKIVPVRSQDGVLTSYEVANMYLPNTKLVVLSACETALGDIQGAEGVYGLQRAFKVAGVKNLIMSLWKVPNEATAEFMEVFYKKMFNKHSIKEAFYKAQTEMKEKYRKDPFKWARGFLFNRDEVINAYWFRSLGKGNYNFMERHSLIAFRTT